MRTRIYVPRETAAISVGADDVAIAIARYAKENKHEHRIDSQRLLGCDLARTDGRSGRR